MERTQLSSGLTGIHHISAMTGDAQSNIDFYTRLLGMRIVKKTVNQDAVDVYHLFYADALGSPGTDQPIARVVAKNGSIEKRAVRLGISDRLRVEVLEGLKEDDHVLIGPANGSGG